MINLKRKIQNRENSKFGLGEFLLGVHSWIVYLFLYLPIIVLIVFSFSKSRGSSLSETLFSLDSSEYQTEFDNMVISDKLRAEFTAKQYPLSEYATLSIQKYEKKWKITDNDVTYIIRNTNGTIQVSLWYGFTFDWYKKLFTDREIFGPTKNSLVVAIASTIISTILGTMIAFAMSRYNFPGKNIYDMILLMPIIIPDIVMGISLLTFYVLIHFTLGLISITIAHVAFNISFVAVVVRARLHGYDKALDEAAMDLGANSFQTFMKVTLPIIAPGVIGGALIAFTLSLDDYLITSLVAGIGSTTLPIKVYSMMKFGVTPEINALSTLILLFTMILILMSQRLGGAGGKIWRE